MFAAKGGTDPYSRVKSPGNISRVGTAPPAVSVTLYDDGRIVSSSNLGTATYYWYSGGGAPPVYVIYEDTGSGEGQPESLTIPTSKTLLDGDVYVTSSGEVAGTISFYRTATSTTPLFSFTVELSYLG